MTLTPANGKNMLFTLRYPPDKIMAIYEGTFTAAASSLAGLAERTHSTISHDFGVTLFLQLTYSQDGGTSWQDQHISIPDLSVPSVPVLQTCPIGCYSTTTQIVIVASNYTTSAKSVMYKVVAFSKE